MFLSIRCCIFPFSSSVVFDGFRVDGRIEIPRNYSFPFALFALREGRSKIVCASLLPLGNQTAVRGHKPNKKP